MEPHLYLNRGKKRILLVRYFDKLHFVNQDHRLNYKVLPWFLEKPRTEAEMDEKGLVRESIPLKDIRGVAAGGTGQGMVVQFYLKTGKKRYELYKDCNLSDMSALFAGLESFVPPKKDSNWHDPRLARQDPKLRRILWFLGALLNAAAFACFFFIWAAGFEIPWLCWTALALIAVSAGLYCRFPDYFILISERRKYGQKKGVTGLWAPVFCPVGMILGAISCHKIFFWWKAWIIGACAIAGLALVLYLTVPLLRSGGRLAALVCIGFLLCGGPVLMLNSLLETDAPQTVRTEAVGKQEHTHVKAPDRYDVTVILDGAEVVIPVGGKFYRDTQIGEIITVEVHHGAFGIEYANVFSD